MPLDGRVCGSTSKVQERGTRAWHSEPQPGFSPIVSGQASLEALDFTMGELCVSVSWAERGSMCTAQEFPGVSVCEMGLVGTLCAPGTARPFPLLARRQASTFPGWGCAFRPVSYWLSAWAKAAGRGGQGTQLLRRIWPLCRDKHLCGAARPHCSEQAECKGAREWAFSLEEPPRRLGFPASDRKSTRLNSSH